MKRKTITKVFALLLTLSLLFTGFVPSSSRAADTRAAGSDSGAAVGSNSAAATLPAGDMLPVRAESVEITPEMEESSIDPSGAASIAALSVTAYGRGYNYTLLDAKCRNVYDAFLASAAEPTSSEFAEVTVDGVTEDNVLTAYYAVLYDNPELFWADTGFRWGYYGGSDDVSSVRFMYSYTSMETFNTENAALENAVTTFLSAIDLTAPPAVIAMKIHDKLIKEVAYDSDAAEYTGSDNQNLLRSHTAYNALVTGMAVCDGYSNAYTLLLNRAGITCDVVIGDAGGGLHAWNIVRLGSDWYEVDSTWDDQSSASFQHMYFNLTTEEIASQFHTRDASGYATLLPTAAGTHFKYDYMRLCGTTLTDGIDSEGNPLLLTVYKDGAFLDMSQDTMSVSWKLKPCSRSDGAYVNTDAIIWTVEASLPSPTFLEMGDCWTRDNPWFVVKALSDTSAGTNDVAAKITFDNGAIGNTSGNLVKATLSRVEKPVFSLDSGTYKGTQSVTITDETEGASIFYTTDNSEPTDSNGALYTEPIIVDSSMTIKAYAIKENHADSDTASASYEILIPSASVSYTTHVENIGWQNNVSDGALAGTTGRSLRLEGIKIQLNLENLSGGISYRTHIENIGWENTWAVDGAMSGTQHRALRLEGIEIKLTGEVADYYDVYYQTHVQDHGWTAWAENGEVCGSAGEGLRLEGIKILLVRKGEAAPVSNASAAMYGYSVRYRTHVENIGWQSYTGDGALSGTTGRSLRLEGIRIYLPKVPSDEGGITYSTHVENIGWQSFVSDGAMAGTSGRSLRLEAIRISLTGDIKNKYDIYYQTHIENFGWSGWASNGESCGSAGYAYRLEAIRIVLVPKGGPAPGVTSGVFYKK